MAEDNQSKPRSKRQPRASLQDLQTALGISRSNKRPERAEDPEIEQFAKEGRMEWPSLSDSKWDLIGFREDGSVYGRRLKHSWHQPTARFAQETSQIKMPFKLKGRDFYLPFGLNIITGGTNTGKSSLIRTFERAGMAVNRAIAVEPADGMDELERMKAKIFYDADSAMVALLGTALREMSANGGRILQLPVLDSLRAPVFETDGPAGKKGIIMPFFTLITRVSNCLALNGMTVVATVNPLQDDPDYEQEFIKKVTSGASCTIALGNTDISESRATFGGQIYLRPDRTPIPFAYEGPGLSQNNTSSVLDVEVVDMMLGPQASGEILNPQRQRINRISEQL